MPNNTILSQLMPYFYMAVDKVNFMYPGFLANTAKNMEAEGAALGQQIYFPKAPTLTAQDNTPTMVPTEGTNITIDGDYMALTKSRKVEIPWEGEQQKQFASNGKYAEWWANAMASAMKTIRDEMEDDVAAQYIYSSRACGVAGTTPFASDLEVLADARLILDDNGCPTMENAAVINTLAKSNLLKLTQLISQSNSGTTDPLYRGLVPPLFDFGMFTSGKVKFHTKGGGTGYLVNLLAGYPVGATSIAIDTGTGTVLAGDVVTFAGDPNKYIVKTGVAAPGTIVLNEPGLRQTLADGVAMTIGDSYRANLAYEKNAIQVGARPMKEAEFEGRIITSALDTMIMTDPITNISYMTRVFGGRGKMVVDMGLVWGVKAVKSENMATIMGL